MKWLLDMPVSRSLLSVLKAHGHEGIHAHEIGLDRATDHDLLAFARHENRGVITADLDFPRLLALSLYIHLLVRAPRIDCRMGRQEQAIWLGALTSLGIAYHSITASMAGWSEAGLGT